MTDMQKCSIRCLSHCAPALLSLLAAAMSPAGCVTPAPGVGDAGRPSSWGAAFERFTGADHGLEIRTWIVADEPERFAAAMGSMTEDWPMDAAMRQRLARSGLRLMRLPIAKLDELQLALGRCEFKQSGWHGQMVRWTPIRSEGGAGTGTALAIDGMVRNFGDGHVQLVARGWTVPTEDGPRMLLQMVPIVQPPPRPQEQSIVERFEAQAQADEVLYALWLETELEAGFAYVLTCESPDVVWGPVAGSGEEHNAKVAESDGLGPEAETPPTLGEALLRTATTRPGRAALIFVPRIPASLNPEVEAPPAATAVTDAKPGGNRG